MFRNLLITMSLSGSIVVVFYILFYPLIRRYCSLGWRYGILKLAVFFYLVPLGECKYYVFHMLRAGFTELWDKIYIEPNFDVSYSIYIGDGVVLLSQTVYKIIFGLFVCGIISSLIFSRTVIRNQMIKKLYISGVQKAADSEFQEVILETQKKLGIKKQIRFICSKYCQSPVTSGIILPVVWFPDTGEKEFDKKSLQYMVKHELLHIKRNDILVKYLGLLVVAVHWFNPFGYFLYHELSSVGEMYCDKGVLEGQGDRGRKEYGELLLQLALRKIPDHGHTPFAGIAGRGDQRAMKRRIMEMKSNRKNRMLFSVMAMMLIGIMGGLTAFAYEPPYKILGKNRDEFSGDECSRAKFSYDIIEDETAQAIPYDQYFVDGAGTIYEVNERNSLEQSDCFHEYTNGTYEAHKKNTDRSCSLTTYKAEKCILCGTIKIGDKISTQIYEECPH